MTRIALFAGGDLSVVATDFDYLVGVDRGSLFLLENGLSLDMAIGDFDSVSKAEYDRISVAAGQLIQAPAEKDDTDTELALKTVFAQFPQAQVTVFGAFGGRIDHMMSNIFLPSEPALAPFMQQISLADQQNLIQFYPAGQHRIFPKKEMTYVSFMTDGDAHLTILEAKYELTAANFFQKKVYSSNEFVGQPIEVSFDRGYLIVIYSKDRS